MELVSGNTAASNAINRASTTRAALSAAAIGVAILVGALAWMVFGASTLGSTGVTDTSYDQVEKTRQNVFTVRGDTSYDQVEKTRLHIPLGGSR
jgi:hypothetical protein